MKPESTFGCKQQKIKSLGQDQLQLCSSYLSERGCHSGTGCRRLHLCKHYLQYRCWFHISNTCSWSHNVLNEHNKNTLQRHGVSTDRRRWHLGNLVRRLLRKNKTSKSVTAENKTKQKQKATDNKSNDFKSNTLSIQSKTTKTCSSLNKPLPAGNTSKKTATETKAISRKTSDSENKTKATGNERKSTYTKSGTVSKTDGTKTKKAITENQKTTTKDKSSRQVRHNAKEQKPRELTETNRKREEPTQLPTNPNASKKEVCNRVLTTNGARTLKTKTLNFARGHFGVKKVFSAIYVNSTRVKRKLELGPLYHDNKCKTVTRCGRLHLCKHYTQQRCNYHASGDCKWLHNVYHEHNIIKTTWSQASRDIQLTRISMSWSHLVTMAPQFNTRGNRALLTSQATFFDRIADLANQKFEELNVQYIGGTIKQVSSALIMKCHPGDPGTVVSFGTGTRCVIHGKYLGLRGETVNDSHAEIITKRGFMRFLYRQLQRHSLGDPNSMFESSGTSEKLRVKSNFSFHLYISRAPCGDAACFSRFSGPEKSFRPTPLREGLLHTKGDGGHIPVPDGYCTPYWNELLCGARLRTMCCSDKVCRWNVLGLQGSLLSLLIDPVYLSSITLGFQYEKKRLSRAAFGRLHAIRHLPMPYQINQPWLGKVSSYSTFPENAKDFNKRSINWNLGEPRTAEVTDGNTGKLLNNSCGYTVSRLSKRMLLEDFQQTCRMFQREDLLRNTYFNTKESATNYQKAKRKMVEQFRRNRLGNWVKKPIEEELFSV